MGVMAVAVAIADMLIGAVEWWSLHGIGVLWIGWERHCVVRSRQELEYHWIVHAHITSS
jgi:hypothetical protein